MLTDVSEVCTASIVRAMSQLIYIYLTTRQYIPEDSKLYTLYVNVNVIIHRNVSL
jgi:hypothetical protein